MGPQAGQAGRRDWLLTWRVAVGVASPTPSLSLVVWTLVWAVV